MGHDIYRATEFDILPLAAVSAYVPPHAVEAHLLGLVRSHLNGGNFLFSYTYDLTRRLQAQWETREADAGRALWEVVRQFCPYVSFSDFDFLVHRSMIASSGISTPLLIIQVA